MIYTDTKKLVLISLLIKETDEDTLKKVEELLKASPKRKVKKFVDFSNKLSVEELDEFERNIQGG